MVNLSKRISCPFRAAQPTGGGIGRISTGGTTDRVYHETGICPGLWNPPASDAATLFQINALTCWHGDCDHIATRPESSPEAPPGGQTCTIRKLLLLPVPWAAWAPPSPVARPRRPARHRRLFAAFPFQEEWLAMQRALGFDFMSEEHEISGDASLQPA